MLVNVLVGGKHSDQLPDAWARLVLSFKQADQGIELVLVVGQGVAGHLLLSKLLLLVQFRHLDEILPDKVVTQIVENALSLCFRSFLVEMDKLFALKMAILVTVVTIEQTLNAAVIRCDHFVSRAENKPRSGRICHRAIFVCVKVVPFTE